LVGLLKFDNGLRVVYYPDKSMSQTGFSVCLNVGSAHDFSGKTGIAHFTEHLSFKVNSENNYEQLYKNLAWNGTNHDAETGLWYTNFYGCTKAPLEEVLQAFFEVYKNIDFDETEFEKEKGVVLHEELKYRSKIRSHVEEELFIPALFNGSELNRKIVGDEISLKNTSSNDVVEFKKKFYVPQNTVIGLSGNFDMRSLKPFLSNTFGSLKRTSSKKPEINLTPSPKYGVIKKKIPGVNSFDYFLVGFLAPKKSEKDYLLADFLDEILSRDHSSRMNLELRERRGIGYTVGSSHDSGYGFMYLFVEHIEPKQLNNTREGVYKVINDILEKGIPEEEVRGIKELLLNHYVSDDGDLEGMAKSLAEQEALKLHYNNLDLEKKIKNITTDQINSFAKKLLSQNKVEVVVKVRPE
ncbi:insulinase family protein, partial [Candidatus Woesearchaeota archaeon]|nr:insulinase family protein [Candidatus Woesearchaeota archaeon]